MNGGRPAPALAGNGPADGGYTLLAYLTALLALLAVTALILLWLGFTLPLMVVGGALGGQALLSAGVWLAWRRRRALPEALPFWVLALSALNLAFYLYGSGGHTNPVISLLLVPLAISAVSQPWLRTLLLALMVMILYSLLTRYFIALEETSVAGTHHGSHGSDRLQRLHLVGMWLSFAVSVLLICALVIPLAASRRRQQQLIATQRETILRDEQLVALATFAASAAHKMATPLATLSVLVDDLGERPARDPEAEEDRRLMAQQIDLCKQILGDMMRRAEGLRENRPRRLAVAALIAELREQFNLLHPDRSLQVQNEVGPAFHVQGDATLVQALLNLLDNAVRVSEHTPEVRCQRQDNQLLIQIRDEGPGVPAAIRERLGQPFVSTREEGLGLGLFLSHASIDRLGGKLSLRESDGGALMEVRLPLLEPDDA
ncbi:MAG: ATP-binding protein [Pseudomonadota bacterium]|nr:ATP-binding protein [Pseudomonadota bacterium]